MDKKSQEMTDNQKGGWFCLFLAFLTCFWHGTAIAVLFNWLGIKDYDIYWGASDYMWFGPTAGVFSLFMLGISFMLLLSTASRKFKVIYSAVVLVLYIAIPVVAVLSINS